MERENMSEYVEPMINALLKIKRGELEREKVIEVLEELKDKSDTLIGLIEYGVVEDFVNGC